MVDASRNFVLIVTKNSVLSFRYEIEDHSAPEEQPV